MSNKPKIFRNALRASDKQHRKTYCGIFPSIFTCDTVRKQEPEFDSTNLWQGLWAQGEMACLFGTPCVGKSILAMQIAKELQDKGLRIIYFNLENIIYPVSPLVDTCAPGNDDCTPDEKLDFIANEIAVKKPQAVIIDDISLLTEPKDSDSMRRALNGLRVICNHSETAMLLLAHSRKRKSKDLTTIDELSHPYEIMHACDSVFSLDTTSRRNSTIFHKSHYIKQHKNRMAPVILSDDAVMAAQLVNDDEGHFIFTNFQRNESERRLVRDNGFDSRSKINNAIAHYRTLCYSTREIAAIVGLSQAQVSRIAKAMQEADASDSCDEENKTSDASDSFNSSDVNNKVESSIVSRQLAPFTVTTINPEIPVTPRQNTNSNLKKLMKKRH